MTKTKYKAIWVKPKTHLKVKKEAVRKKLSIGDLIDILIK